MVIEKEKSITFWVDLDENKMKNNATHGRFIAAISQAEGEFEVRLRKRILHAF